MWPKPQQENSAPPDQPLPSPPRRLSGEGAVRELQPTAPSPPPRCSTTPAPESARRTPRKQWRQDGDATPVPTPLLQQPEEELDLARDVGGQIAALAAEIQQPAPPPTRYVSRAERARQEALAAFGGMTLGEVARDSPKKRSVKAVMTMKEWEAKAQPAH